MNDKQLAILQKFSEFGILTIKNFFPKQYSYSKMYLQFFEDDSGKKQGVYFNKKDFSNTLYRLQQEGLVMRSGAKKSSVWKLTSKGRVLISSKNNSVAENSQNDILRLVIFDIPEKESKKRRWLRSELIGLDYKILQKSVWMGKTPLPEDFVKNIKILNLNKYVHIFSIYKQGTIDS